MRTLRALISACALLVAGHGFGNGTETLGSPDIAISPGTGIAVGGVGLFEGQPGTIQILVPSGATINQVILYLGGGFGLGVAPDSMSVLVDSQDVVAAKIGGVSGGATYRADITGLGVVQVGGDSVEIDGLDFSGETDGAGLLVIYEEAGAKASIDLRDGKDYAFIGSALGGAFLVTEPQTFEFASSNKERVASLDFFAGSVAGGSASGISCRPSSFEVTTNGPNGTTAVFSDQLDSLDGALWDTVSLAVTIPKRTTSVTVQIFSRDDRVVCPGNRPASLTWVAAALALQTPGRGQCWITTGGFHNTGDTSGSKDFTFGGNVGPPPKGSWQVIDHLTGDNFHAFDVSIVSCETITLTGPDQPGGKKGFKINQATFEGIGRFNHVDGFPFTGMVQDAGEPAGKKGNDQDFFQIIVRDPTTNAVVFETSATLDGGNVQIHPPTGKPN